jgi:hypothetical protein
MHPDINRLTAAGRKGDDTPDQAGRRVGGAPSTGGRGSVDEVLFYLPELLDREPTAEEIADVQAGIARRQRGRIPARRVGVACGVESRAVCSGFK